MTTLHITVGDRAQLREDALQFIQTAEAGELDASDERAVLQFGTYDDLVDSLTPLRLDLIQRSRKSALQACVRLHDSSTATSPMSMQI